MRTEKQAPSLTAQVADRHLRVGWWSLAGFGLLGLVLETLHGFKVPAYLDVPHETRRLMWTLAHAHGSLLGLVHIALSTTLRNAQFESRRIGAASTSLLAASVLLPVGFFLGGLQFYAGDPGIGIALVPVGAALTIFSAVVVAREVGTKTKG